LVVATRPDRGRPDLAADLGREDPDTAADPQDQPVQQRPSLCDPGLAGLTFAAGLLHGRPAVETLMAAIALAVSAIPKACRPW